MAGTDRRQSKVEDAAPVIILVESQLGENIGAAARAMMNSGLYEMRLVSPRPGWKNAKALSASASAVEVVENAQVFETLPEALADLSYVYASSARPRDMVKPVTTPRHAAADMRNKVSAGTKCGILFGREKCGLGNDDLALADMLIQVPLNPGYSSLNLAQAVMVIGYEWFQAPIDQNVVRLPNGESEFASKEDLHGLFNRFEGALEDVGFFREANLKPKMVRNLRAMLQRAQMTEQEVRTFHGVVTSFMQPRTKK